MVGSTLPVQRAQAPPVVRERTANILLRPKELLMDLVWGLKVALNMSR